MRILVRGAVGVVCALVGVLMLASASAQAVVSHQFLPEVSKKISEGVPASSGALLTGPLSLVNALTVDSGHLWVGERLNHTPYGTSIDEFDASTGVFLSPQLNEEGGVYDLEHGVAVGHVVGEPQVYVAAKGTAGSVLAVFDGAGKLQGTWSGSNTPNGSFDYYMTGVAVDGSANPETSGDVYVSGRGAGLALGFNVVNVFKPEVPGVEPGKAAVKQLTGTCATPGTACPGEVVPFSAPTGVAVSGFNGDVVVTDNFGVVDVFEPGLLGEYVFVRQLTGTPTGPEGTEQSFISEGGAGIEAVAVDGSNGDIYVADAGLHVVDEFDREGTYLGHLTGTTAGPFHMVTSVAVDPASPHDLFVGDYNDEKSRGTIDVFGPNLVLPDVTTTAATTASVNTEGVIGETLNGMVNPNSAGEASCNFVWGTSKAFGHEASCEPAHVPNGGVAVPVHSRITGLASDTTYFYRLRASNEKGLNPGEEQQDMEVLTPGPGLRGESVSGVASTSGTLEATIDPNNAPTSYYFEYGKSTAYESQVPSAPGASLGSSAGGVEVGRHVQGLTAGTLYHFRVVAVSEVEVGPGEVRPVSFPGPDATFSTQGAGEAFTLPDARRWELVSPPDKHGALIRWISEAGVVQSSVSGGSMTYLGTIPTEDRVPGYTSEVQMLSNRGVGGWSSQDVSLPHAVATGQFVGVGNEYRFFSADLSLAIAEQLGEYSSFAPEVFPPDSEKTPYVRHNATCASVPARCYEPLLTSAPGYADVPEGTEFGGEKLIEPAHLVGATPDVAHVIIYSGNALTSTSTGGHAGLYEWSAGMPPSEALQLVSRLPKTGGAPSNSPVFGRRSVSARHALSDDGSRIVWAEEPGHLYLRDTAKGQTVQLDVPDAACVANGECGEGQVAPRFQIASSDGTRVFFTDVQRLTTDAGTTPNQPDLYECEIVNVGGELQCVLSDLTPHSSTGEVANMQGEVVGASEDGSWVYFVANGVLGNGADHGAVAGNCEGNATGTGACNLYEWHDGKTSLVAVLSGKDFPDWSGFTGALDGLTARVSSDGRWLAFMSDLGLTGYDTRDAVSGKSDEEVYLYHAKADGSGSLVCASCDRTGARPVGAEYKKLSLVSGNGVWPSEQWIAGNIPGYTPYRLSTALYQSRYLSDEGRLFFNSNDTLVPQDINSNEDVYQFEPLGVGDCSVSSVAYSAVTGGCVGLISSGRAVGESAFMDASASGNDVFFLTGERLVSQDVDTALDVYDARSCSAVSPCVNAAVSSPPCTTADACRSAPLPQPSVFGAPSSETFFGAGNVSQPGVTTLGVRSLTRVQKLTRALSACHKKKSRRKRGVCERRAHRRYGAKAAVGKPSATKRGRG